MYKKRLFIILTILMVVIVFSVLCTKNNNNVNYKGYISGLISDGKKGSKLIAYNVKTGDNKIFLELPNVLPDNYGAVSSNGKKVAYTTWNQDFTVRYLVVLSLESKEKTLYFNDMPAENEIEYISWLPDNKNLIFIKRDASFHDYQEICMLNTETNNVKNLVNGEVWRVKSLTEEGEKPEIFYLKGEKKEQQVKSSFKDSTGDITNYYLTNKELKEICKKYGGWKNVDLLNNGDIDINKVGSFIMVEFSAPVVSYNGSKILYSATITQTSCEVDKLPWIASSIWIYDIDKGTNEMIFSDINDKSAIGRSVWNLDNDKEIFFISYDEANGTHNTLNILNLETKDKKTIFPATVENYNNVGLISIRDNKILFTSSKQGDYYEDSNIILLDLNTKSIQKTNMIIDNKNFLPNNFLLVQ